MPPRTSFELRLPSRLPRIPYQFARIPNFVVGCAMIAGVHSTVWIFAISAAVIRRAFAKSSSSVHLRVLGGEPVGDRVVLAREERVQERQPEPEVPGDAGEVDLRVEVARQLAVRVEAEPAARVLAERARDRRLAAVDLRAVPPVRVGRHPGRGAAALVRERIGARALDPHRPLGPRVVVGELELEWLLGQVLAVAEPVVHLELEPCSGEDVDDRGGLELLARQQPAADEARVRVEQAGQCLGVRVPERDVAAEARADHPHRGAAEVVVAPVRRRARRAGRRRGRLRAPRAGVVEVLLAELCPEARQRAARRAAAAAGPSRSDGRALLAVAISSFESPRATAILLRVSLAACVPSGKGTDR